jgi:GNAT superfamily N-acetyltransferase
MPIVVDHLQSPTAQDRQDLEKIYYDAPSELFAPFTDAAALIENGLREKTLIGARFNDRLLGAARLIKDQRHWQLSQLCVRKLTRRRGVAERLVSEAGKLADAAECELRLHAFAPTPEACALASKLQVPLELLPSHAFRGPSA